MKYRVVRTEVAPKLYMYRIVTPWNSYTADRFADRLDALRWIRDNVRRKP